MKKFNSFIHKIALFAVFSTIFTVKIVASTPVIQNHSTTLTKQEFTKNFDKTFTVDKNEVVILANKYGKIEVKTGGTNQVVVNVRVRVNAGVFKWT
jgi:hypothetical protein